MTPYRPHGEDPDEPGPGNMPVEPDQGPVPPVVPNEQEHEQISAHRT